MPEDCVGQRFHLSRISSWAIGTADHVTANVLYWLRVLQYNVVLSCLLGSVLQLSSICRTESDMSIALDKSRWEISK